MKEKQNPRELVIYNLIQNHDKGITKKILVDITGCSYRTITTHITALLSKRKIKVSKIIGHEEKVYVIR